MNNLLMCADEAREIYKKKFQATKENYLEFVAEKVESAINSGSKSVKIKCRHPEEVRDYVVQFLNSLDYDVEVHIPGKIKVIWG